MFGTCIKVKHEYRISVTHWDMRSDWAEHWKLRKSQISSLDIALNILIVCHIVGHLRWQLLPEITKMATNSLSSKVEACNKNWTPLSLCQSQHWHVFSYIGLKPLPEIIQMATIFISSNICFLEWFTLR